MDKFPRQIWMYVVLAVLIGGLVGFLFGANVGGYGNVGGAISLTNTQLVKALPVKNCISHTLSSGNTNGNKICQRNTRNTCLFGQVTMDVMKNNPQPYMVGTVSRFISCDYNFNDFNEDDELIASGQVLPNEVSTTFQVVCCSS